MMQYRPTNGITILARQWELLHRWGYKVGTQKNPNRLGDLCGINGFCVHLFDAAFLAR